MALATYADAVAIYGHSYVDECCDRNLDGTVDAAAFELACDRATNTVYMYIAGRVPLPFTIVPESAKRWCIDIAIEDLCATADVATEIRSKRADLARKELLLVSQGKLRIVQNDDQPAATPVETLKASVETERQRSYVVSPSTRQFTRSRLRGL